jgi:ClpP class serine protease
MTYPKILAEIADNQWAMRLDSFEAILGIISGNEGEISRSLFHASDETEKQAFTGDLGRRVQDAQLTRIKENVGFVDIDGPIVHRVSGVARVSGLTSIQGLTKEFDALESNPAIDTIVLLLDTPGGVVKGTSEFADQVAASKKKTVAYIYGAAASAGYWIASAADMIVSSDVGIAGSLGVVMTADTKVNKDKVVIVSSQTPDKRNQITSKRGRKSAQRIVDDLADVFIAKVATNMSVSKDVVEKKFGAGEMFVAQEAKERGMIDGISTLHALVAKLTADKQGQTEISPLSGTENTKIKKQARTTFASESKQGGTPMATLAEMMAEHPTIKGEIEDIKSESFTAGVKSIQDKVTKAVKFFENKNYPEAIKNLCIEVLKGEQELAALTGAVTVFDAQAEMEALKNANDDNGSAGDTPPQDIPSLSNDGIMRSEDDFNAILAEMKNQVGA